MGCLSESCNIEEATVQWDYIPGFAELADKDDLVAYEIEDIEQNEVSNHTATRTLRTGTNTKWVMIKLSLFPCHPWLKALELAWKKDTNACGVLTIYDPCCPINGIRQFRETAISKMALKNLGYKNDPVEVEFKGILV